MNGDIMTLVRQAQDCGAVFSLENEKVILQAPEPIPPDLLEALRKRKSEVQQYLKKLPNNDNWLLEEWRKTSIPSWRRVLQESIDSKDSKREAYARWMLRDMLADPEYRENL